MLALKSSMTMASMAEEPVFRINIPIKIPLLWSQTLFLSLTPLVVMVDASETADRAVPNQELLEIFSILNKHKNLSRLCFLSCSSGKINYLQSTESGGGVQRSA